MRHLIRTLLVAGAAAIAAPASADFYLVVNSGNPQRVLTKKEAVDLFMGRSRSFANGEFAQVFDLPRDHPRRAAFYRTLTGMSPAVVNSYWSRLMFSGQNMPPQPLADETTMIDVVKGNPNALGWLGREPTDKLLRTLLVLEE